MDGGAPAPQCVCCDGESHQQEEEEDAPQPSRWQEAQPGRRGRVVNSPTVSRTRGGASEGRA
eukprot:7380302-Prymnesium_polylepis.1